MPKGFSSENAEYEARLARIALTAGEKEKLGKEIGRILDYVSQLNEVPTEGVEPTYHVVPLANVLREDRVEESLSADEALGNAPDRSGNFFRVPRII